MENSSRTLKSMRMSTSHTHSYTFHVTCGSKTNFFCHVWLMVYGLWNFFLRAPRLSENRGTMAYHPDWVISVAYDIFLFPPLVCLLPWLNQAITLLPKGTKKEINRTSKSVKTRTISSPFSYFTIIKRIKGGLLRWFRSLWENYGSP